MKQEKRGKPTSSDEKFPKGDWNIYVSREDDNKVHIGYIKFIYNPEHFPHHSGEMEFLNEPQFHKIAGKSYQVMVSIGHIPGVIAFQIPEAALEYDRNTSELYRFIFEGFYDEGSLVGERGSAKVPAGFAKASGPPTDEGDTVSWTAEARGDESPKSSE
jgi:hypothetical protein